MPELRIQVSWRTALTVEHDNSSAYFYPQKFTPYFRRVYATPAVYRWRLLSPTNAGKTLLYIGQTDNLVNRVRSILSPSKHKTNLTSRRLAEAFGRLVADGHKVALDVADVEPFEINGERYGRLDMEDQFKRCVIENLMLVEAEHNNCEILNAKIDVVRKFLRLYKRLSPIEKARIRQTLSS